MSRKEVRQKVSGAPRSRSAAVYDNPLTFPCLNQKRKVALVKKELRGKGGQEARIWRAP